MTRPNKISRHHDNFDFSQKKINFCHYREKNPFTELAAKRKSSVLRKVTQRSLQAPIYATLEFQHPQWLKMVEWLLKAWLHLKHSSYAMPNYL